jgi:hypothetical protein
MFDEASAPSEQETQRKEATNPYAFLPPPLKRSLDN